MSRKSRVPGNFSHHFIGKRKAPHGGWRNFHPTDPNVVHDDPNDHVASISEATGNIVVTFTDAVTGTVFIDDMAIYAIPLVNKHGEGVTFRDPFVLMTQAELISITGDYGDSNEHEPCFGFAIGQNPGGAGTDAVVDGSNHWIGMGHYIFNASANVKRLSGRSKDATGHTSSKSSNLALDTELCHCVYSVGPSVGTTTQESDSVYLLGHFNDTSGNAYAKDNNVVTNTISITQDNATFDSDGQVYLYAWFGSYQTADGSADASVLTCRMRYMCDSNLGWGGTGT